MLVEYTADVSGTLEGGAQSYATGTTVTVGQSATSSDAEVAAAPEKEKEDDLSPL